MYTLAQVLIILSSLIFSAPIWVGKEAMSDEVAIHLTYYQYGSNNWIENDNIECKLYVHYEALDLILWGEENALEKDGICIWRNADWEEVQQRVRGDRDKAPKDVMFLGHGVEDKGTIRFGNVATYLDLMFLVEKGKGKVGVLSCRGKASGENETASLNTINPYLENGLWIWGEEGKVIKADLKKQVKAFFEKP